MTLLITIFSAVIATVIWYISENRKNLKLGTLSLMYWGASLMWLVDAVTEYLETGAEFFNPSVTDMLNDAFLGFSVTAFGLVIWIISLLISDPKNILKLKIKNNRSDKNGT
ncbi:MAG: hypothetical protein NC205_07660 [Prevotella sp.]|nr:hypothetical protein [Alistipes senegalensis]MCM1358456.1 hypothetical protein [Prevotella sp.]MCM1474215.1 hypothetical protein [Muribaculaceae bacterium]